MLHSIVIVYFQSCVYFYPGNKSISSNLFHENESILKKPGKGNF